MEVPYPNLHPHSMLKQKEPRPKTHTQLHKKTFQKQIENKVQRDGRKPQLQYRHWIPKLQVQPEPSRK